MLMTWNYTSVEGVRFSRQVNLYPVNVEIHTVQTDANTPFQDMCALMTRRIKAACR